jgi:hypothetical protein
MKPALARLEPAQANGGSETFPRRYGTCHRRRTQASCVQKFPFMVMNAGSADGQCHLHAGDHRALPGDGQDDHVV